MAESHVPAHLELSHARGDDPGRFLCVARGLRRLPRDGYSSSQSGLIALPDRMLARLRKVLDEDEDRLRLYPASDRCVRGVRALAGHESEPWAAEEVYIV